MNSDNVVFEIDNPNVSKSAIPNDEDNSFNIDDEGIDKPFTPSDNEVNSEPQKEECPNCKRKFFIGRLAPHLKSCTSAHPFKPFKAEKKSQLNYSSKTMDQFAKPNQSKWKLEHEYLKQNIRFSKKLDHPLKEGEDGNFQKTAPNPLEYSYIYCQYCQRKFAPHTAEKHIPKCKNIFNRPQPPKNKIEIKKKQPVKALEKYSQYVGSSINEEQEEIDNDLQQPQFARGHQSHYVSNYENNSKLNQSQQRELGNSQPVFLPRIQNKSFKGSIATEGIPLKNEAYIPLIARSKPQIQCSYCNRTFESRAAERHIPICEKVMSRSSVISMKGNNDSKQFFSKLSSDRKKNSFYSPDSTETEQIKFCTNCGAKFANFHKFCGICGRKR